MIRKVLFVCIHNSARSQIAEALLKKYGGDEFDVESAGFEPGILNPLAVEVLKEEGIDIEGHGTNSVFDLFKSGRQFNFVITVCDEASAQKCPVFPGLTYRINWSFEDPASLSGSEEEKREKVREIKEKIKANVMELIDLVRKDKLEDNMAIEWKIN